jgi:hypothetical protein
MKNKIVDLHNHLFEQIERLNDDDLKGDDLTREISRAQAMWMVAGQIISGGKLMMEAAKTADMYPGIKKSTPLLE